MLGSAVGLGSAGLGSAVGSIIKSGVLLTPKVPFNPLLLKKQIMHVRFVYHATYKAVFFVLCGSK